MRKGHSKQDNKQPGWHSRAPAIMLLILGVYKWLCGVTFDKESLFEKFGLAKFLKRVWHLKSARRIFYLSFCVLKISLHFVHISSCTLSSVYMLERSLCWGESIICMHTPIRPMNADSRQLASQSRSAEIKWKWELRGEFTQWLWQKQRT